MKRTKKGILAAVIVLFFAAVIINIVFLVNLFSQYNASAKLCHAINAGKTDKALALVAEMDDVNTYSAPLSTRILFNLMEDDIDLPLVVACEEGNSEVIEALLQKGADPNQYLDGNWSPMEALFVRRVDDRCKLAEMLMAHGAEVDGYASYKTALFYELETLKYCDPENESERQISREAITMLLENGASPIDKYGDTIAHYLAAADEVEMLEEPLMWAIESGAEKSAALLMEFQE